MSGIMTPTVLRFWTNAGVPLASGKVYTYVAGTTTPKTVYKDAALSVAHTNPITLDANGSVGFPIFGTGTLKLDVKDSAGASINGFPVDNIYFGLDNELAIAANIAALRSMATPSNNSVAYVLGYYSQGDGGEGWFSWNSSSAVADNGGTVISPGGSPSTGRWVRPTKTQISALWFGAKGDGATNDGPAISAAIAALPASGGVVFLPKTSGSYLVSSTINIGSTSSDSFISILGESGATVTSALSAASDVLFNIKNFPSHLNLQGISNLRIVSSNGNGTAIKLNGQCFGKFDNLYIEGFTIGILLSNAGTSVFTEFNRFNHIDLHLCATGLKLDKDGGTDTSMHGTSFENTTINVASGQTGIKVKDVNCYNAKFEIVFFGDPAQTALIDMETNSPTANKGVFGSGSIYCEGTAKLIGSGRFWYEGPSRFMSGVTDTLSSPDAWEHGFLSSDRFKPTTYGGSGLLTSELNRKSHPDGLAGPVGSMARLSAANNESVIANCYTAHASTAGNGFYTGYTGYQQNYSSGVLGWFVSSDGTEIKSVHPTTSTYASIKHNGETIIRFNGVSKAGTAEGFLLGTGGAAVYSCLGTPEGVVAASVGSICLRRDGGASTTLYVKESGTGNTGWIAK